MALIKYFRLLNIYRSRLEHDCWPENLRHCRSSWLWSAQRYWMFTVTTIKKKLTNLKSRDYHYSLNGTIYIHRMHQNLSHSYGDEFFLHLDDVRSLLNALWEKLLRSLLLAPEQILMKACCTYVSGFVFFGGSLMSQVQATTRYWNRNAFSVGFSFSSWVVKPRKSSVLWDIA